MVVNTYGISVGIEKIGWKLYLVYIGWICVELVIIYFVSFFLSSFFFFLWGASALFVYKNTITITITTNNNNNSNTARLDYTNINCLFFLAVLCGNGRENIGRTQADFRGAESSQGIYSKD